jgi:hypothetical protein
MLKLTFPFLVGITRCLNLITPSCQFSSPFLWKSCGIFTYKLFLSTTYISHTSNICSLGHRMSMSLILCRSSYMRLVISLSYHDCILVVLGSFPQNIMYLPWFATSYNYTSFMFSMWTYHWWFGYPLALMFVWEWTHYIPWYFSGYRCNYCFAEWNTHIEKNSPPFPRHTQWQSIFLPL